MWPISLDMTRDECRGILRRSELESYSSVVSTFRAQGELSENKVKILKELRDIFHISQDRHRAEARRAANDERLSTIAEAISGPNTGQEWKKEGHRTFPLLPRSAPYTCLSVIADGAVENASKYNQQLPFPSETALVQNQDFDFPLTTKSIVTEDPLKSNKSLKRDLKRPYTENVNQAQTNVKKRISDTQTTKPIHTNMRIQQLYHTYSNTPIYVRQVQPKQTSVKTKQSAQKYQPKPKIIDPDMPSTSGVNNKHLKNIKTPSTKSNKTFDSQYDKLISGTADSETALETPLHWPQTAITISETNVTPPVQIVYTSQVENLGQASNLDDNSNENTLNHKNNLITESTPVTWLSKKSQLGMRSIKMVLPSAGKSSHTPIIINKTISSQIKHPLLGLGRTLTTGNIIQTMDIDQNTIDGSKYTPNIIFDSAQIQSITTKASALPTIQNQTLPPKNAITVTKPLQFSKSLINSVSTRIYLGNQQIQPIGTSIKLNQPIQVKATQGKNNVKIIPSFDGTVILNATDTIPILKTTSNITGVVKNMGNKVPLQKVQLLPSNNSGKANMVLVQNIGNRIGKQLKDKISIQNKQGKLQITNPVLGKNQSNVVVLDVCEQDTIKSNLLTGLLLASATSSNTSKTVITEDTPVDILPSENISTNGLEIDNIQNLQPQNPNGLLSKDLTNTTQIMRHLKSATTVQSIPIFKNNTIVQQLSTNKLVKQKKNYIKQSKVSVNAKRAKLDINKTKSISLFNTNINTDKTSVLIGTTDWEDELDQANSIKTTTIKVPSIANDENQTLNVANIVNDGFIEEDELLDECITHEISPGEEEIIQYEDGSE